MTSILLAVCLLVGAGNRVAVIHTNSNVIWQYPAANVHDAWMLPNGNVLFGDGKAITEVTPDKKIVWRFADSKCAGTIMAVQMLTPEAKPLPSVCLR
jgi:hypothetical protein